MTIRETALRAAVLKALTDVVKADADAARDVLADVLRELQQETGASSVKVDLGGASVATVTLAGGKMTARVSDERALLAWVQSEHPSEVEPRVRESFRKALLDDATSAGFPVTSAGEAVPGVEIVEGSQYVSQRFANGGRELIAAEWRAGNLDLPAITT